LFGSNGRISEMREIQIFGKHDDSFRNAAAKLTLKIFVNQPVRGPSYIFFHQNQYSF